ncbi:AzlC family ABC transporter permease [Streptomyces radicis]|uniref:Branched-chain amino acid ABC transporter permease n=1 Tax=Streptomyces radicis TaxID=1750517 RepID=A0A3A9VXG7_9ACTN|nr:AzlC family ABC transporter permease [Streptomyces radicis]RKN05715.1 branched-chain amino acid ABC transporter permease [Streptomyces radicis]RKN17555.1 branched-chain amino acid ABC transporter permease [Streptomyces radicis]
MRSFCRTLDRTTLRDIALVCCADALVAASFGAIAVSGGLPPWVPVVMSLVVFAGAAQFAAVAVVLSGGGVLAAVLAALVLNARLLPFGFAVADLFGGRGGRIRTRLVGAHLMTDEAVAFALRQREPGARRAAYWVSGVALFVSWNGAVLIGALVGGGIEDTGALGLDAAFPVVLLALVLPSLADRATRRAALVGAAVAVAATPFLPPGLPVLCALLGVLVAGRGPLIPPRPAREPLPGAP